MIALGLAVLSALAWAQGDCEPGEFVSVRDRPPARQGDLGLCYAYSATQLFDALLGDEAHVSSGIAAAYESVVKPGSRRDPDRGGEVSKVLKTLLERGSCPAAEVERHLGGRNRTPSGEWVEAQYFTATLYAIERLKRDLAAAESVAERQELAERRACQYESLPANGSAAFLRLAGGISDLTDMGSHEFVRRLIERQCTGHRRQAPNVSDIEVAEVDFKEHGSSDRLGMSPTQRVSAFRSALGQRFRTAANDPKAPPVAVEYCLNLLEEGAAFRGLYPRLWSANYRCSKHAGVIVARRWNALKQRCEVRLRDSQGVEAARSWSAEWERVGETQDVWVAEETLALNTEEMIEIRKKTQPTRGAREGARSSSDASP